MALPNHRSAVFSVRVSPDGSPIVTGSRDGRIKLSDAHTGRELLVFGRHDETVLGVDVSPDGGRIVSAVGNPHQPKVPGELKVWDARTGQLLLSLVGHTGGVVSASFSPDGKRIVSGGHD